jgi:hypothetical protein
VQTIRDLILTGRQDEAYHFLLDFYFQHGAPAYSADVGAGLGVTAERARQILEELVRKGWLVVKRLNRGGHTRPIYAPTVPAHRVRFDGTVILLGTMGGPVRFTVDAWRDWLAARLREIEVDLEPAEGEVPPVLRIHRDASIDHKIA